MDGRYIVRLFKANEGQLVEQLEQNFSSENEARNFIKNYNGNHVGQLWVIVEGNNLKTILKKMKNKQRDKWDAKFFIRNASKFLEAGNKLSSDLNYLDISCLLGHLAIEQLLKGFLIWDEKEAPRIHFVFDLSKSIGFNLGKELESKLRKIDTFFNRYPMNEEEWEKTRKQLIESNYQSVEGIDLPGESSTMDWNLILEIWCELVQLWIQEKFPMELNDFLELNSIAIRYPSILLEWDFDNNKFSPIKIAVDCKEQISWKCKKNHLSQAFLKEYYNRGCKECSPELILSINNHN